MLIIVYIQLGNVSTTRADTHAWEGVRTCRLLLIGHHHVGVQTGQPHAGDAIASWPCKQLWPHNRWFSHLATVIHYAG